MGRVENFSRLISQMRKLRPRMAKVMQLLMAEQRMEASSFDFQNTAPSAAPACLLRGKLATVDVRHLALSPALSQPVLRTLLCNFNSGSLGAHPSFVSPLPTQWSKHAIIKTSLWLKTFCSLDPYPFPASSCITFFLTPCALWPPTFSLFLYRATFILFSEP